MQDEHSEEMVSLSTTDLGQFKFLLNNEPHVLLELTGKERDAYVTKSITRLKVDAKGSTQSANMDGFQSELIQLSLHKGDANGARYMVSEINTWPASVQAFLYKKARKLSGLRTVDSEDEDSKNG